MSHSYVSVDTFKSAGILDIARADQDARLLQLLEGASREVEALLSGRHFYPVLETRYFGGKGTDVMTFLYWDLISVTTLKEDENGDATYETTWASTDYELAPYDADPTDVVRPRPYWIIEVNGRSNGNMSYFAKGQKRFELAGVWGYCNLTEATGATINEGAEFSASDTTLTVSDGSKVSVGDLLLIESEQMYVSGRDGEGSDDVTVVRGMNGTTAVAHADTTAISRQVYPTPVIEAVVMRAAQLRTHQVAGYASQLSFGEVGPMTLEQRWPQVALAKLDAYRRPGV